MRKKYLEDINLDDLPILNSGGHQESTLFHDDTTVYKIFDDLTDSERNRKQTKVELLGDGGPLPLTIMPQDELVYGIFGDRFEGYSMDYIKDAKTLYYAFTREKNYISSFLYIMNIVSQAIKNIHSDPRNIVISDVHADNIILDKQLNPYLIDMESAKIDGIKNDTMPLSLKQYLSNRNLYSQKEQFVTTKNTDRLCLIMMTLGIIFRTNIDKLSLYEFDKKTEQIETLKNMRNLVIEIQKSVQIPEVPYIHELIEYKDILKRILIK